MKNLPKACHMANSKNAAISKVGLNLLVFTLTPFIPFENLGSTPVLSSPKRNGDSDHPNGHN